MNGRLHRLWDPLYGRTDLTDFEFSIISSPEFQRLRYIRMCNINSMLITGASDINRFEHSLGVLRLAKEWLSNHGKGFNDEDIKSFTAAALLHDMITGPFGHSFQYVVEDNDVEGDFSHDDVLHGSANVYYQQLTSNASFAGRPFQSEELLGKLWEKVSGYIHGVGSLGRLISGTIDIDNIDNVFRLGYHVGVANSSDAEIAKELTRSLYPKEDGLAISEQSLDNVKRWQDVRHDLYELLLLDWAEFSAKAMLTLATELAIEEKIIGAEHWKLSDGEYINHLENNSIGESQKITELVKRLRCGDLYYPIALLTSESTDRYKFLSSNVEKRKFEQMLGDWAKEYTSLKSGILVHYILDVGKTDRSVALSIKETGQNVTIGNDSKRLLIGIFSSQPVKNLNKIYLLRAEAVRLLDNVGVRNIEDLSDPIKDYKPLSNVNSLQYSLL